MRKYSHIFGCVVFVALNFMAQTIQAQSGTIHFTDVTNISNLSTEQYRSPTRHSLGVVWLDVNLDGYPDIFATNGFNVSDEQDLRPHLYMNDGVGGFDLADEFLPDFENYEYAGAIAADYDRDGDVDIFIYTVNENFTVGNVEGNPFGGPPNLLLKNGFVENGNALQPGLFTDVASLVGLDGCSSRFRDMVLKENPNAIHTCSQSRSATFLDYDLDGWIDLYVAQMVINRPSSEDTNLAALGARANKDIVFRNNGDGTFRPMPNVIRAGDATLKAALVARAGHFDDDIWPDVYVGNVGGYDIAPETDLQDAILINNQEKLLEAGHEYIGSDTPAAMGTAFGDINGDGRFDIYITDDPNHPNNGDDPNRVGNTLYISHDSGFSSNLAKVMGVDFEMSWGTNFSDFDLDGDLDLFVGAGLNLRKSTVFAGLDSFNVSRTDLQTIGVRGSALADYDQDGDHDILVSNQDGTLQLFRNDSINSTASSLTVNFNPTRSNLDAIGLRADLYTTSGKRLSQQITGGNSSHSQDFNSLIFGLNGDTIDRLEIRWPHVDTPVQIISAFTSSIITVSEPELD